ncbi:methylthioadenosine phosphorylase [Candidatus Daviesbacteria bacterium RIFCSPLOWO2_01_FULL_43_38]|uniref:Purine nucleoside phosphorylase n=2 Tax=Candidatus Daviesiibacteriota TaxID=1752718 RepID=A0A1F5K704_9BACT|nr:MAG: Purine nucleoside phosphorylase [Candidatus Daviesbacteria bacterium GW2011_GWA2_42_7]OGE20609.1 MAG: methylthioadenosine phosphorylase [Candidatus Daviesbacteria bacterium RIFCSPHIGHO2_01_FULL_43_17]OGE36753.1 MAG: methylthioadenosine phosphorylase [Candidatus Daviesbacteria bacterium RIFCSPHIGHO2_12_FULL_43_11]OGE63671.1 MAG: methylthioadenosine phosphorylase [Candidatus Daviesbacteria bacterium RIFCSPLOWO2_01_FULL_43_38]
MKSLPKAEIGVFGGSGFYSFFEKATKVNINTPYGKPSAEITIAEVFGKKVAFLPRHGLKHQFPPHKVPFKANIYAFKKLGVKTIISPCAAGSLQAKIKPGDFVILDQFIDRTKGREDTYFNGPEVAHIGGATPYCPRLSQVAIKACRKLKIQAHKKGTVVVVPGPRFSTAAESMLYTSQGGEVINMTQYPEVVLAREMEICFLGIALITDYDVGLSAKRKVKAVDSKEVIRVFNQNLEKSRKLILEIIKNIPAKRDCLCATALEEARIN